MRRSLFAKLAAVLCGMAIASTALTVSVLDRTLYRQLERAASERLETAAGAAALLIEQHLVHLRERATSVAGTPQFRASLGVGDTATLAHYAAELRRRESAALVAFLDEAGRPVAVDGRVRLLPSPVPPDASLVGDGSAIHAVVSLSLDTSGRRQGRLVIAETIGRDHLELWSRLCNAEVVLATRPPGDASMLARQVVNRGGVGLWVRRSLEAERAALASSRRVLLLGGGLALLLALGVGLGLSRWVAGRIRQLNDATRRIGRGEFDVVLPDLRDDELGELFQAVREMAARLGTHDRELKERNAELVHLNQALTEASEAKNEFLANVSHEIRTPMAAILGYTEMLRRDELPPGGVEAQDALERIHLNGAHLLELLGDILDLSRIEAGQLELEIGACDARDLASEAVDLFRGRAEERGLELVLRASTSAPVRGDPRRLRQVLLNLVGNAVKFTEQGRVDVEISVGASQVRLEVRDTGPGLPTDDVEQLFEPFVRGRSHSRAAEGTGLGLAIVRRLVDLMGGSLEVTSERGRGSCFAVSLPRAEESQPGTDAGPRAVGGAVCKGLDILVAEDGADNQRLIRLLLERSGARVTIAPDGGDAVREALASRERGQPFDLILMDIQMPEVDGYSATTALRDAAWEGPIVAVTAHAMEGTRERCLECGCDDFLTKPLRRDLLFEAVARNTAAKAGA